MDDTERKNWQYWRSQQVLPIYKAIWLSKGANLKIPTNQTNLEEQKMLAEVDLIIYDDTFITLVSALKAGKDAEKYRKMKLINIAFEEITRDDFIHYCEKCSLPIFEHFKKVPTKPNVPKPEYTTPYLELMFRAIIENEITETKQSKKDVLKEWFLKNSTPELKISSNKADMMATLIRLPESEIGGNTSNRKARTLSPLK